MRIVEISGDNWRAEDGRTLKREYGETPNGNKIAGRWVLRAANSGWIDFDTYFNDLTERHSLEPEWSE